MDSLLYEIKMLQDRKHSIENILYVSKPNNILSCMELYEFELKGYTADGRVTHKFGHLKNVIKGECGIINVTENDFEAKRIASCDTLASKPSGTNQKGGFNIFDYYNMYLNLEARGKINTEYYSDEERKRVLQLLEVVSRMNNLYIKEYAGMEIKNGNVRTLHEGAFIYKIDVLNTDKIIIFGDFHGSFHTFLRHIFRLRQVGIITSLANWRVADGYKIIFLGDILDRGVYALEILTIICELMHNNNTKRDLKVIYNRGNHEVENTYDRYGFMTEYNGKIQRMEDSRMSEYDKDRMDYDRRPLLTFFALLPSAILLKNESGHKFWLSHGGFPITDDTNVYDIIRNHKKVIFIQDDNNMDNTSVPTQIRWNDFSYNLHKTHVLNKVRGAGYVIFPKMVKQFMHDNNISFIIRGHQDNPDNSFLISNKSIDDFRFVFGSEAYGKIKDAYHPSDAIIFNTEYIKDKQITDAKRNAVYGPIARINLNGLEWKDNNVHNTSDTIFPIITLSTNTDMGRAMKYDSFAILRFDLNSNRIASFDTGTNVIDSRNAIQNINFKKNN